jgi:hypothetical protein
VPQRNRQALADAGQPAAEPDRGRTGARELHFSGRGDPAVPLPGRLAAIIAAAGRETGGQASSEAA